jgi:hypothetical protein
LPVNNFGRLVLIAFIIFCLIVRNAYQGIQFEMMTKNMRKPSPTTMKEALDKNFTFHVSFYSRISEDMILNILKDFASFHEGIHPNFSWKSGLNFYEALFQSYRSSSNKFAFLGWKSNLKPFNSKIKCTNKYGGFWYNRFFFNFSAFPFWNQ